MVLDKVSDVIDQLRGCIYQLGSSWLRSNEVIMLCFDSAKSVCKCMKMGGDGKQRGARACKGKGEGEGKRAHLRPPGRIARWRSASKHHIEEGVEGGGGIRATVACHNIK